MNPKLARVLTDHHITLFWADEVWPRPKKHGWSGVSDVAVSRTLDAVSVPRRRADGYHFAEVLHEVVHLEIWRKTGKSPARQDDAEVWRGALLLAKQYGFNQNTVEWCEHQLQAEVEGQAKAKAAREKP